MVDSTSDAIVADPQAVIQTSFGSTMMKKPDFRSFFEGGYSINNLRFRYSEGL